MSSKAFSRFLLTVLCFTMMTPSFAIASALGFEEVSDGNFMSKNWQEFSNDVQMQNDRDRKNGIAYMITGAVGVVAGAVGYMSSQDPLAKIAFSLTESLAIAGIGYGAYRYNIGSGDREFENIISNAKSLSPQQRDEILVHYLDEKKYRRDKSRTILMATYGTIALANLVNASQEKDPGVRTGLYFLAGFNALGVLSLTF